jgi:hypothetical protein
MQAAAGCLFANTIMLHELPGLNVEKNLKACTGRCLAAGCPGPLTQALAALRRWRACQLQQALHLLPWELLLLRVHQTRQPAATTIGRSRRLSAPARPRSQHNTSKPPLTLQRATLRLRGALAEATKARVWSCMFARLCMECVTAENSTIEECKCSNVHRVLHLAAASSI